MQPCCTAFDFLYVTRHSGVYHECNAHSGTHLAKLPTILYSNNNATQILSPKIMILRRNEIIEENVSTFWCLNRIETEINEIKDGATPAAATWSFAQWWYPI